MYCKFKNYSKKCFYLYNTYVKIIIIIEKILDKDYNASISLRDCLACKLAKANILNHSKLNKTNNKF